MTLDAYLNQAAAGSVNRLAEQLGVTASTVSKWRYGRQLPSLKDALAIETATNGLVKAKDLANTRGARKRRPLVHRKSVKTA